MLCCFVMLTESILNSKTRGPTANLLSPGPLETWFSPL